MGRKQIALVLMTAVTVSIVSVGVAAAGIQEIHGHVTDTRGTPLFGVDVTDNRGQTVTTSPPSASYLLSEDFPDTYRVTASRPGLDSKDVNVDPIRALADVDISLTYIIAGSTSASAISTANGASAVTLTVTTSAPDPGSPGQEGKSCVRVTDSRTGLVEDASFVSTDGSGISTWRLVRNFNKGTSEGSYSLTYSANDCASGLKLTKDPSPSRVYLIDNTAPIIDLSTLFPLDGTNSIFTSQRAGVKVSDSGGSGLALGGTTFGVTKNEVTTQHAASYSASTGWAKTSELSFSIGDVVRLAVTVRDNAGNASVVTQRPTSEGGGFLVTDFNASPTTASFTPTSCTVEVDPDSPVLKRAVCNNVPLVFGVSSVWIGGSRHSYDRGYVEHTVSLSGSSLEGRVAGVPVTMTAYDASSAAWADKTQELAFRLPAKETLGQTLTVDSFTRVIPQLIVKNVPPTWESPQLKMPSTTTRGTATSSDLVPWTAACPDPSLTSVAATLLCVPDPTSNNYTIRVNKSTDGGPTGSLMSWITNNTKDWATVIRTVEDNRANRSLQLEVPPAGIAGLSEMPEIESITRRGSIERLINEDRSLRSGLYFDYSLDHVTDLYFNPGGSTHSRAWGALFNPSEEAEFLTRLRLQEDGPAVEGYVNSHNLNGVYGGMWLDHAAGGVLKVAFTGNASQYQSPLSDFVDDPDRLQVVQVSRTLAELESLMSTIEADRTTLHNLGFDLSATLVNTSSNQIQLKGLEISNGGCSSAAARYPLEEVRCGIGPMNMYLDKVKPDRGTRQADKTAIWTPGIDMTVGCTLSFALRLNGGGEYLSTAGHCTDNVGQEMKHTDGRTIGRVSARQETHSPAADMGAIQVTTERAANGFIYRDFPDIGLVNRARSREARQGWTVCLSGARSQYHCGVLIAENVNADLADARRPGVIVTWRGAVSVSVPTGTAPGLPGDSGAPVWIPYSPDPAETPATGLVLGGGAENFGGARWDYWLYTHLTNSSGTFILEGYSIRFCGC